MLSTHGVVAWRHGDTSVLEATGLVAAGRSVTGLKTRLERQVLRTAGPVGSGARRGSVRTLFLPLTSFVSEDKSQLHL